MPQQAAHGFVSESGHGTVPCARDACHPEAALQVDRKVALAPVQMEEQ